MKLSDHGLELVPLEDKHLPLPAGCDRVAVCVENNTEPCRAITMYWNPRTWWVARSMYAMVWTCCKADVYALPASLCPEEQYEQEEAWIACEHEDATHYYQHPPAQPVPAGHPRPIRNYVFDEYRTVSFLRKVEQDRRQTPPRSTGGWVVRKPDLKPCPFCGDKNPELHDHGAGTGNYIIACNCGVLMTGSANGTLLTDKHEIHAHIRYRVIKQWNRREAQGDKP